MGASVDGARRRDVHNVTPFVIVDAVVAMKFRAERASSVTQFDVIDRFESIQLALS